MNAQLTHRVKWEGTEPYYATADESSIDLWVARFLGIKASRYTAHDPGEQHSDAMRISDFKDVSEKIREGVKWRLESSKLVELLDLVSDLVPDTGIEFDKDNQLTARGVECSALAYLPPFLGFRITYTVGYVTEDDFIETLSTTSQREAAIEFVTLVFKEYAKEQMK